MSADSFARRLQKLYAKSLGYFWIPCPLCDREFGGHEWADIGELSSTIYPDPEKPLEGTGICPVCTAQGKGERPTIFKENENGALQQRDERSDS